MKVVMVTGSLGEGAGGLSAAVKSWAQALADDGVEVTIFCLDLTEQFGASSPLAHERVNTIVVPCVIEPRTRFIFAPKLYSLLRDYCQASRPDVIHAHGVWLPGTRFAARVSRRLGIPLVVSPHGHLQPWAMSRRSWKKWLAWKVYGKRSLSQASLIQAASPLERDALCGLGVRVRTEIIPNIVDFPSEVQRAVDKPVRKKTLLFLSRVHPSKGPMDLVEAWHLLRPKGWCVTIAGPDEVGYLSAVRSRILEYGLENEIACVGPVPYQSRWEIYSQASLFVLPTYSENFGITVAEALSVEVPVITTMAAPWQLLEAHKCGWWIQNGVPALVEALREALSLDAGQLNLMGKRGRRLMLESYSASSISELLQRHYRSIAH